ncbi:MAG TPA: aldo/keto reductase [Steroidobacteraceae bacterium]|nr:aldo/keto reductase [Steroidobacteraceae bacterium]
MQLRSLGQTNLKVSPLMLGGNVFGWTADQPTSFAILDEFVGAGGNFIDTADVYSTWGKGHTGGESETVIGHWFKQSGKRANIVLATKVGMVMSPEKKGLKASYIEQAVEDSLRRLQTDYIDLYFSHTDDAETPLDETLRAYQQLMAKGKIRAIGASNYTAVRLMEAAALAQQGLPAYRVLQPHYNLAERADYESLLEPTCRELGLGVVPYFSLARGFLTGKYRSDADFGKSVRGRGMKPYLNERGFRILAALDSVAAACRSTPAQVALAWLMARKSVTAPIASATSVAQVRELSGAMTLNLSAASIADLDQASHS